MKDLVIKDDKSNKIFPRISLGEFFLPRLQNNAHKVALVQQVDGVEVSVTYSELLRHGKVMAGLLRQHGLGSGDTVDGVEVSVTYSELLRHGKVVAGLLRQHGLGSGDTVMLCCGNTLEVAPIMLGTLFIGAALAPVNPAFDSTDLLFMINTNKPQIVISNQHAASSVQEALTQYNTPVEFITMEAVNKRLKENPDVKDFYLGKVDDPDTHVAHISCSSGTTGRPKGVEITHTCILSRLHYPLTTHTKSSSQSQEVLINFSGPYWVTCIIKTTESFQFGHKLIFFDNFTPETFLSTIQQYSVTQLLLSPDHVIALAKFPDADKYDLSSLHTVAYAGSAISKGIVQRVEQNLRLRSKLITAYGMSECFGFLINNGEGPSGNVGKPRPETAFKVTDIDTGVPLSANIAGEICIKSSNLFKGYRGNSQATAAAFDEDGFLRTGDIGYYDDDGYVFVIDRLKETYKYNGIFVTTADIEEVLLQHPDVFQAAVVGIYNEAECFHSTAFVVCRPNAIVTEKELVELVENQLPQYKWLHGGVQFLPYLPMTISGKVQKHLLRKTYERVTGIMT